MRLRLLHTPEIPASASFDPPPFSLAVLPGRPGQGREALAVGISPACWSGVVATAATARIPAALMATIWIDAERALVSAVVLLSAEREPLVRELNAAASTAVRAEQRRIQPSGARRLAAYARCVAFGDAAVTPAEDEPPASLDVTPEQLTAWHAAAIDAGMPLASWIDSRLATVESGRQAWEGAAALAGVSLGEWVLAQAARSSRR